MDFKEYQDFTETTAIYPDAGKNLVYPVLGLCGEAGEIAEKVKKIIRDDGGHLSSRKTEELCKELGDLLWYVARVCSELGVSLDSVVFGNVVKLRSRLERGVLRGSGDNR